MRRIAIIVSILGLGILLALTIRKPIEINSIENLKAGTLITLEGIVSEEKDFSFGKIFRIGEIPAFCECKKSYEGKKVSAIGVVEDYYTLRVHILEIKEIGK